MKKRKIKPTRLQKRAVAILKDNPKMSFAKAMKKAGYKPSTSGYPKQNFLALKGTAVAMEQWREALRGSGLDEQRLLNKYNEWIDAKKIKTSMTEPDREVPDYETQLKVKDDIRRDLGMPVAEQPLIQSDKTIIFQIIKKDDKTDRTSSDPV